MMVLDQMIQRSVAGEKQLALLMDPDSYSDLEDVYRATAAAVEDGVDYIFVGGSHLMQNNFEECLNTIKKYAKMPVILFPGSPLQVSAQADALLFLSLISGRNPEMLIGHHVTAAPSIKKSGIEVLPTGYMLIESGCATSVSYISNTTPIPANKTDIATTTAMAGEMLGLQLIYMDAGSGAMNSISEQMIRRVKESITAPLIIGGGIKNKETAEAMWNAGADIIVIGNAAEHDLGVIKGVKDSWVNK